MSDQDPSAADGAPVPPARTVRRLVTGVDEDGKSAFVDDSLVPGTPGRITPSYVSTDLWRTHESPVDNGGPYQDPTAQAAGGVGPAASGTVFRILEVPPDKDWRLDADGNEVRPLGYHATASLDYAIVLSGEVYAVLDTGERLMRAGDVLIQRGTGHAWSNRSDTPAVLAFVLIGGTLP